MLIEADLLDRSQGGLAAPVQEGTRSIAFVFDGLGGDPEPAAFGAVIERVLDGGAPGGPLRAVARFWADLAAIYATPGTTCALWLGRTVGRGVVRALPPEVLSG